MSSFFETDTTYDNNAELLTKFVALLGPAYSQYLKKGFSSHEIAERAHQAVDIVARNVSRAKAKTPKTLSNPKDRERFMNALEEYFGKGTCSVQCDACGQPIAFRTLGPTVWEHHCACGKYSATLRGL
jgi:hypothetical protein